MNVLLVYGGKSCERDISIITACLAKGYFAQHNLVCAYLDGNNACWLAPTNLPPARHVDAVFKDRLLFLNGESSVAVLRKNKIRKVLHIDCAVNCCHGVNGEDGSVAGLLQLCNIPLVGGNIAANAIAMDKCITKILLRGMKIPVVRGVAFTKTDFAEHGAKLLRGLGFPIIVKPARLGSSIGVGVAHNEQELASALNVAFAFDSRVLCEKALTDFTEINCSAMTDENGEVVTGELESPMTAEEILTFKDKYTGGKGFSYEGARDVSQYADVVAALTKEIYSKLGFVGVIRVDFLADNATGKVYVNEINSVPGSLAYGLWKGKFSQRKFGDLLLRSARADFADKEKLSYLYASEVLSGLNGKKK